jgi:hypothetical protein
MIFLQGFIKFDQGISEKSDGQNCAEKLFLKFSNWSPFQNGRQYKNKKNKNKLLEIQI